MLDKEHFVDAIGVIGEPGSGVTALDEVRRWVSIAPIDHDDIKTIHVRLDNRYYRLVQTNGGTISVEGFVGWPHERNQRNPYLYPDHMTPISITENGAILSHGIRISPHHERLGVLSYDLSTGRAVSEAVYTREKERVDDHI